MLPDCDDPDCDEWEGLRTKVSGYGKIYIAGEYRPAHRIVWMQTHGHTDLMVLHHCDNPPCINIDHLYEGTAQDNSDDKIRRGRIRNGQADKTECKWGHPFDEENTYKRTDGRRSCRACSKLQMRKKRQTNKESNE